MQYGVPVERAIRWACYIGPRDYGLHDFGAVAPGFVADFPLLDSLDTVHTCDVFIEGRQVVRDRRLIEEIDDPVAARTLPDTVNIGTITADDFAIAALERSGATVDLNAIELLPTRMTQLATITPEVELDEPPAELAPEGVHGDDRAAARSGNATGLGTASGLRSLTRCNCPYRRAGLPQHCGGGGARF